MYSQTLKVIPTTAMGGQEEGYNFDPKIIIYFVT